MKEKRENKRVITFTDFLVLIMIIGIFSVIIIQYYSHKDKMTIENNLKSKFVSFNDSQLELEYNSMNKSIEPNYISTGIVVLAYHGIYKDENRANETNGGINSLIYSRFKEHMFALKKAGYETIDLKDLYLFLRGEKQLPEKSFVITFDDGIKDSYYNVDPILKILNYKAVMFTIVYQSLERNDNKYYLNKEELHKMRDSGRWNIESHSYRAHGRIIIDSKGNTGPYLANKAWIANENRSETDQEFFLRVQNDFQISKIKLEKEFNDTVLGFAIPFGEFGQSYSNYPGYLLVPNVGGQIYPMIFYQFRPATDTSFRANFNDRKMSSYLVKRITADRLSTDDLLKQIDAAKTLDLPYIEKFDNPKRWISRWHSDIVDVVDIKNKNLDITNYNDMLYLDGSYLWKDYIFSGIIKENGSSDNILLLARYHNSGNYVACKFSNDQVSIDDIINNVHTKIDQIKLNKISGLTLGTKLATSVVENTVGCYINDNLIIEQDISDIPPNGGIGIIVKRGQNNESAKFSSIRAEFPYYGN